MADALMPGAVVRCHRSKIPRISLARTRHPPSPTVSESVDVHILSRVGPNSATWNVRVEPGSFVLLLDSNTILAAAIESQPLPNQRGEQRGKEIRQPDRRVMAGDSDDDDWGSDDSLDDAFIPDAEQWAKAKALAESAGEEALAPHGLRWKETDNLQDSRNLNPLSTRLLWSNMNFLPLQGGASALHQSASLPESRQPIHYFLLAFPVDVVHGIVERTNKNIRAENDRSPLICTRTFFVFIGLLYYMASQPKSNRKKYWATQQTKLHAPSNFGRFMTYELYEHYFKHISWSAPNPSDRWAAVRDFLIGINSRRSNIIQPADKLTIRMAANSRTRQSRIAKKPDGLVCDIRCVVDGRSQIILQVELQESKEEMATNKLVSESAGIATACALRLLGPWFNTGRTVYGDSSFGSVNTAVALRERGLHFIGVVKADHKEYPKQYFNSIHRIKQPGTSLHMEARKNDIQLYAVAWRSLSQDTNMFIATAGSSAPAPPHKRTRYRLMDDGTAEAVDKSINLTAIPYEYFNFAQKADVRNRQRQLMSAMERSIHTASWSFRLITSVLGLLIMDAFMMYSYSHESESAKFDEIMSFDDFMERATHSLLTNSLGSRVEQQISELIDEVDPAHATCCLVPLSAYMHRHGNKRKYAHLTCSVCRCDASFCCGRCSTRERIVTLCGPRALRPVPCFSVHLRRL